MHTGGHADIEHSAFLSLGGGIGIDKRFNNGAALVGFPRPKTQLCNSTLLSALELFSLRAPLYFLRHFPLFSMA